MPDFLASVRRSFAFRAVNDDHGSNNDSITGNLMDRISSGLRKSRLFSKSSFPSTAPLIRYRKGELIGCGAFGQVYMGMNLDSGELLAVKQVLVAVNGASREKAQAHIKELEEEVKLLKNLSHPNIVRYLGTVREEKTLNILLEFVPGGSISSLLGKFGPFPEAVIRTYTTQILLGLQYLHNNGIIHRDIKGANILVDNKGCIKLADFGASKQVFGLATMSGVKSMKGTPYWMAPEVILQTGYSFSADIWSVGCTVIEMATGKPPWSQQYQEVAAMFHVGSTKSHPEIPDHLSSDAKDFLLKCLKKEPDMRPEVSVLLQHPFVVGENKSLNVTNPATPPLLECQNCGSQNPTDTEKTYEMPSISGSSDLCNIGRLSCSITPIEAVFRSSSMWDPSNGDDDDMCQLDKAQFALGCDGELCQSPSSEPGQLHQEMVSLSKDDEEVTESKIKAFLDEMAFDMKKLQTPLHEEFYNSFITTCPSHFAADSCDETHSDYLKLPPKTRSPTLAATISNNGPRKDPTLAANNDLKPESSSSSQLNHAEKQKRWKEELYQELEIKSEMMGMGSWSATPKTRSPTLAVAISNNGSRKDPTSAAHNDLKLESNSFSQLNLLDKQKIWKEELDQELETKKEMMRMGFWSPNHKSTSPAMAAAISSNGSRKDSTSAAHNDAKSESSSSSQLNLIEKQKRWKEELDQELEAKREMMRMGIWSPTPKTRSPTSAAAISINGSRKDPTLAAFNDPKPESPSSSSSQLNLSERQKRWKEELDQEFEIKREMMRMGSKLSSSKDRVLSRQRDRTRFACSGR